MLNGRLPVRLDPIRFCEAGRELSGTLPIKQMGRLTPLLCSSEGEVGVRLSFGHDIEGRSVIKGQIEARLELTCQRCLEAFVYPVSSQLQLAVVANQAEAEDLPEYYDPLIPEADGVFLRDLVEDELLLALPSIAKHPDEACSSAVVAETIEPERELSTTNSPESTESEAKANPFAALQTLKD